MSDSPVKKLKKYDKVVYVSHPFQNKLYNTIMIEETVKALSLANPNNLYICPVLLFGFMYEDVDYETGLRMSMYLLNFCDEMQVYGDYKNSVGCQREIEYCKTFNISVEIHSQYPFK